MAITQTNEYQIGVNNDLGNLANNVDNNRIGEDLTWLELDGSTIKVSVGSFIESQGNLYVVDTAAETPTGTPASSYLFFDESVPGFVWSSTPGTYDPARGGIYDASNRRQCRWFTINAIDFQQTTIVDGRATLRSPNFYDTVKYDVTENSVGEVQDYLSDGRIVVRESTSNHLETWEFSAGSWSQIASSTTSIPRVARVNETRVLDYDGTSLAMWDESGGVWSQTGSRTTVAATNDLNGACLLAGNNRVAIVDNTTGTAALEVWDFNGSNFTQVGSAYSLGAGTFLGLIHIAENLIAVMETASEWVEIYEYNGTTFSKVGSRLDLPASVNGLSVTNYRFGGSFYNGIDFLVYGLTSGNDVYLHIKFDGRFMRIAQGITGISGTTKQALLSKDNNYSIAISEVLEDLNAVHIGLGQSLFRYKR